jgi:hypothetical protein
MNEPGSFHEVGFRGAGTSAVFISLPGDIRSQAVYGPFFLF